MADTKLLSELVRQREAAPPARDRLMTTMFLVGALHALVILGVTFTAAGSVGSKDEPTLAVLLVRDPVAEQAVNTQADYLAQVNQHGAGTDPNAQGASSPHTPPGDPTPEGEDGSSGAQGAAAGTEGEADLLSGSAAATDKHHFAHNTPAAAAGAALVMAPPTPEIAEADSADELVLRGHAARELIVTPNTRESSVAVYLDGWRRKVERVGTSSYQVGDERRAGLSGSPELEVQILADGTLGGAVIRRSSGHPELDRAALAIVHLASPYEPFPASLASQHDALRFSYDWQFLNGKLGDSTVRVPANTR